MRVIPPIAIDTTERLTASSVAEVHNPAEWVVGTSYVFGNIVKVAADFAIYECILVDNSAVNLGHTPSTSPKWWRKVGPTETAWANAAVYAVGATVSYAQRCYECLTAHTASTASKNYPPSLPEKTNTWWVDVGPANKWAMFDANSNTQTIAPTSLTVTFNPGLRVNTIGVTGMDANSITITASSVFGGGVVFGPFTTNLNIRNDIDGASYAFEPFGTQPSLIYFDVPTFSDIVFTVTLNATETGDNVKCGSIVVGTYAYLGEVKYGAKGDALNFSTVERDIYGNATLVPRLSVPKINVTLTCPAIYVNKARAARSATNAVSVLWAGVDDGSSNWFDMLLVQGVYQVFEIDATNHAEATITLEVQEI